MYKLTHNPNYIIGDAGHIPTSLENIDYQQYLKWASQGNEPLPADPLPEPQELTVQEKLQAAGLTIKELKEALGL